MHIIVVCSYSLSKNVVTNSPLLTRFAVALGFMLASVQHAGGQILKLAPTAIPTECIEDTQLVAPAVFALGQLEVSGEIDGSAWSGTSSAITVGSAAKIGGDLLFSPSKVVHKAGDHPSVDDRLGKFKAVATKADLADRIRGKQTSLARPVGLPRFPKSTPVKAGRDIAIEDQLKSETWSGVRNVTVQKGVEVTLPPGAYGDVLVEKGTLILGNAKAHEPSRYTLSSLSTRTNAKLRVVGPVVVYVDSTCSINGPAGSPKNPQWLDLRFAGASVEVGPQGDIYGFLVAPDGTITLKPGAHVTGAVTANAVALAAKALVTAPPAQLSRTVDQPFLQKALRVEARMPALMERHRNDYSVSVGYADDIPHVLLVENKRAENPKLDQLNNRLALLGALADALVDTGFDKAVVTLARSKGAGAEAPTVTNYPFTRHELDLALRFAGGMNNPRDNIRRIIDDPLALNVFSQYCDELAEAKRQAGR